MRTRPGGPSGANGLNTPTFRGSKDAVEGKLRGLVDEHAPEGGFVEWAKTKVDEWLPGGDAVPGGEEDWHEAQRMKGWEVWKL